METLPSCPIDLGKTVEISDSDISQLHRWNSIVPTGSVRCLHDLVIERAETQPETLAIDAWDSCLTYGQLANYSLRLAQSLVASGVRSGSVVSLCFEKSKWTTVAMLGTLRAGAAFVLVDPALPLQRARTMVELVDSTVLLTSHNVELDLSTAVSTVLFLDQDFFSAQSLDHSSIELPLSVPQDVAIVLFTSGSTGSPKAILQDHIAASTTALGLGQSWNIGPDSRVLQFASYVFDMSIIDTFMTIVNGGCLCVPSKEEISANPAGVIHRMQINLSAVTASVASTYPAGTEKTLRTLVLGGEKVPTALIEKWADKLILYNGYGPAEGSVCSFASATTSRPTSIGFPLNTLAWVVDETDHNRLVPIGEVGELLIEGPMLAKGYLRDPQKTGLSFIVDPEFMRRIFGPCRKGTRRLYKTGDLVRQQRDGSLDYCGRKDLQTKLRGQRIELAEVEYNIQRALPSGWTSIVDVVELEAGATLVGFIRDDQTIPEQVEAAFLPRRLDTKYTELQDKLNTSLAAALPSFMVPSSYWLIPEIPMTLSRKTDRSALKRMGKEAHARELMQHTCNGSHSNAVKSEELEIIQEQWSAILHLDEKGIDPSANFFSLGGNSLLAMRLAGSLNTRFPQAGVTVRQIFENPSMHLQCQLLKQPLTNARTNGIPQPASKVQVMISVKEVCEKTGLEEKDVEDVLEATDAQSNMLWAELTADACEVHHCVLEFKFALNTSRLERAIKRLMKQHSILRTCFAVIKGKVFQCVLKEPPTNAVRIGGAEMACNEAGNLDKYEIGSHGNALFLARWNLESKEGKTSTAILRISHCLFDGGYEGGFMHRILAELSALYQCQTISPSPAFSTRCIGGLAQLNAGIAYWKETLYNATPSRIVTRKAPYCAYILRDEVSRRLELPTVPSGTTIATLVKAAWALVLSEVLQTKDVIFAGLTSGRALPVVDAHRIIGPCISTIPNRILIPANATTSQFLSHVQNQYLDAIPYETVGLQTICQECTDWPRWEDLSTVVNDLSEENFIDRLDEDVDFGNGNVCKAKVFEKPGKWVDIAVRTKKVGTTLHARLAFNAEVVPREVVEEMNDMLIANVKMLSSAATELRPALRGPVAEAMKFPLSQPEPGLNGSITSAPTRIKSECAEIVSEGWRVVFGAENADTFIGPFYDKWPVACAWPLQKYYRSNGYDFTFDEVLRHPSKDDQARLLESRRFDECS